MNSDSILSYIRSSIFDKRELEYFLIHKDRYRTILHHIQHLNLPARAKVLDVGCYPPHMFIALQKMGFELSGISSEHEPVKTKNVVVLNIEKDELPFKKEFFDVVLFSEVMEHLVVNPLVYLEKFKTVLKKDGVLLVTTPNAAGLHKRIPALLGRSTYFPLEQVYQTKLDDGSIYHRHNREYTKKELEEILQKAGFSSVDVKTVAVYGPFREKVTQHPLPKRIVRGLAFFVTVLIPSLRDTLFAEVKMR